MTVTLINEIHIGIRFRLDSGFPSGCFTEEELLEHMNVTLPKKKSCFIEAIQHLIQLKNHRKDR